MNNKVTWKAGTLLAPVPVVMVTCQNKENKANIITIGWVGTICSEPPMVSISVRPSRHSYNFIKESGEFVINIPTKQLAKETDLCGVLSGSKYDKFHETGLTKGKSKSVKVPIISECPINLECKVKQEIPLGSHSMFIAEKANLLSYAHGNYLSLNKSLGKFGFSVKKK